MADDGTDDLDRAAILARRRRFIALAISGLAATGCKRPVPEPCLSIAPDPSDGEPSEPPPNEPFIEQPGAPLETGETGETETGETETGDELEQAPPEVCLKVAPPRPCLKKRPSPHPCLLMMD